MKKYRVVKRTGFNAKREKEGECWVVQYEHTSRFLWFKSKTIWETVQKAFGYEEGTYYRDIEFETEEAAIAYVERAKQDIPKDRVVEEVVSLEKEKV